MKIDGQAFLQQIAGCSNSKFEIRFSRICTRIELGPALNAQELSLLYEAAFLATLCNISFNGGCGEEIQTKRETVRSMLEREYMGARGRLLGCAGIQCLTAAQEQSIERVFLQVFVREEHLA